MTITVCDEEFILIKERALFLPEKQLLVISDLHLGKSAHFRRAGLQVPSTVAQSDLQRLSLIIERYAPQTLLINGDMFHHQLNSDVDDFSRWKSYYRNLEFILVKGNHDRLADKHYQDLGIHVYEPSYCTDKLCFIHDSTACKEETLYPISGHIHPGVTIIGKAKQRLRFPCFYFGKEYAILPAFSAFTGLFNIKPNKGEDVYAITPTKVLKV
ncbi:ligase-associated DNA damage response endonuclease PdeM [Pedobacter insulae]|uniref:Putative phosphoesterase, SbcD/Mre11-related/metallophosphoesterase, DNA ligase-associated n=1 Tax=Pedobacter insulae TaxID=414048 RepID=A0A1I2UR68_9SPHI|nr:ligase-associated DNA damage response endonuclease PdeM [Pedobacter insulae]SFG79563.1 putative phosphoesterase, SbcD/Mre11-related/metallophosphoesterase, DNA ligase-associated [Pedobacter insulae]